MSDLLAARSQMGISLAFHIVFAVIGIAMPVMMVVAERRWQVTGHAVNVEPIAAMGNAAALSQTIHMTLAAYAATGFAVAGIHAFLLLRDPANAFHRRALEIALIVAAPAAVLQPLSGDLAARHIAVHQPVKLAAAEAVFRTQAGAPLTLGGWPDVEARETRFAVEVPYALSLLAFH